MIPPDSMNDQAKQFQRHIEDFVCAKCGAEVRGNGYTNHCPKCLWSRHVDVNPGDRAATCGGMMRPVGITTKGDGFVLKHRCETCGFERNDTVRPNDDFDAVIALSKPQQRS